jgi:hypothetical protein
MIPGFLVALVTFPGVIVHEAAHMFFCKIRKVAILDVCFLQPRNPAGYVIHEEVKDFTTSFLVAVGPLIINSALCFVICFPAYLPMQAFDVKHPLYYVLLWLGVSIGMHAFPSNQDARNLLDHAKRAAKSLNPLAILSFPLVAAIYVANLLTIFWLDYAYGIFLGIGLPELILRAGG